MNKTDTIIIISINVHEKVNFLLKQLENIKKHVLLVHYIILNCNDYMNNALKDIKLPSNVIINNDIINKERFTGTLTQGIYSNIKYAITHYNFKYFIILSSRNLFYNILCANNLDRLKLAPNIEPAKEYTNWHWPTFLKTELAKFYIENGKKMVGSCHEGLVFHYDVCQHIVMFLEKNTHIKNDLFTFPLCVEEFALQTISMNESNGFGVINESINTNNEPTDPDWLVYKTDRI
jgi:hypothetical protein